MPAQPGETVSGYHTDNGLYVEATWCGSEIRWQDRPRSETGGVLIGDTPESLLPIIIVRLQTLNHSPNTPSRETSLAITKCEEALHWLRARREARETQGVLGTYAPHDGGANGPA